ncbi:MAG: fibronectin type III domain-containing protein [Ignavibacteriaceae bacterium]|nr:fibronectin type III domain-containing protein [Ignavibacteriaceae bacterium]
MKNKLTILALFALVSFSVIFAQTKTAPVNSLTGVSIQPVFTWTYADAVTNFDIAIKAGSSSTVLNGTGAGHTVINASTTVVITGSGPFTYTFSSTEVNNLLDNNTKYYWNVIPDGQAGTFDASSNSFSFTTTTSAVASLISPVIDANVPTYRPVLFSWSLNAPVGSLTFKLQYVTNDEIITPGSAPVPADWANAVITTTVPCGSDVSRYTENLAPGTKYWWRVITYYGSGIVSYSLNRSFTTGGGAVVSAAVPSWPGGSTLAPTNVPTNTPTLYWYTNNPDLLGIIFAVEIATDEDFTIPLVSLNNATGLTGLNYVVDIAGAGTALNPGRQYWWRVVTTGTGDDGPQTSAAKSFKTNGTGTVVQPNASYPLEDMTVYTQSPTFRWYLNTPASGITYKVYIDGVDVGHLDGTVVDQWSYLTPTSLLPGDHTWSVVATNGTVTLSSDVIGFTVAGGILQGLPVAYWPVGNATIYTTTPTLSWYLAGSTLGLESFKVAFSTVEVNLANFNISIPANTFGAYYTKGNFSTADANTRSVNISDMVAPSVLTLGFGQHYYWAVASYDAQGASHYSVASQGEFTIAGTTGSIVPVASYPKGDVTIHSTSATLSWYVTGSTIGIDHYRVVYSRRSDLVEDGINTFTAEPTDQNLPITDLVPGATYYWKVASHNGTALSDYSSPTASFVVAATANGSVIVPLVGGPSNNVSIATTSPMISWVIPTQAIAPLKYELQYSKQQDMSSATTVSGINSPSQVVTGLSSSQEYYWRVRSVNEKGESSAYSEAGRFVVNATTAVEDQTVLPTAFALSQNYPNPFNPTTQISYALPQNSYVSIKVYDMLGREVKTLLNNEVLAGNHSVTWNGDDNNGMKVVSGVYLYKINAGDFVKTMKLILMK